MNNLLQRVAPEVAQTADDLRESARYIDTHGWCQGALRMPTGEVCALGAIMAVTGDWHTDEAVRSRGAAGTLILWLEKTQDHRQVADWNNAPSMTQADVTSGLEKAAAWLEEQA